MDGHFEILTTGGIISATTGEVVDLKHIWRCWAVAYGRIYCNFAMAEKHREGHIAVVSGSDPGFLMPR